jgi:hypothetical protein
VSKGVVSRQTSRQRTHLKMDSLPVPRLLHPLEPPPFPPSTSLCSNLSNLLLTRSASRPRITIPGHALTTKRSTPPCPISLALPPDKPRTLPQLSHIAIIPRHPCSHPLPSIKLNVPNTLNAFLSLILTSINPLLSTLPAHPRLQPAQTVAIAAPKPPSSPPTTLTPNPMSIIPAGSSNPTPASSSLPLPVLSPAFLLLYRQRSTSPGRPRAATSYALPSPPSPFRRRRLTAHHQRQTSFPASPISLRKALLSLLHVPYHRPPQTTIAPIISSTPTFIRQLLTDSLVYVASRRLPLSISPSPPSLEPNPVNLYPLHRPNPR